MISQNVILFCKILRSENNNIHKSCIGFMNILDEHMYEKLKITDFSYGE